MHARTLLREETSVGTHSAVRFEEESTGEGLYDKGTMRYGYVIETKGPSAYRVHHGATRLDGLRRLEDRGRSGGSHAEPRIGTSARSVPSRCRGDKRQR